MPVHGLTVGKKPVGAGAGVEEEVDAEEICFFFFLLEEDEAGAGGRELLPEERPVVPVVGDWPLELA